MRHLLAALLLLLGLAPSGCAGGSEPFAQPAARLPPVPAHAARIFVYRDPTPYAGLAWVRVFFNGRAVGAVGPGQVILRDVPAPDTYRIAPASQELWPDQDKIVAVRPGETVYAKIAALKSLNPTADRPALQFTYIVVIESAASGRRAIDHLRLMNATQIGGIDAASADGGAS